MSTGVFDCANDEERLAGLDAAAAAIRRGELVVFPTDTVYGIAADAFSESAVNALLSAKGRGPNMPVGVLVSSTQMMQGVVESPSDDMNALIEKFWPGPLSIVVKHPPHLGWNLGETKGTVMVRMPDQEIALDLIARTGPLASSSANRTGHPAATTLIDARLQLGAVVPVYLDGGPSPEESSPSTIVDLTSEEPSLLRIGPISREELAEVLPAFGQLL